MLHPTEEKLRERFIFLTNKYKSNYYNYRLKDKIKAIYYGVKYLNRFNPDDKDLDFSDILIAFSDINYIKSLMSTISYGELLNIFPIEKDFDGHKWECKDYFDTIEYLKDKDLNDSIGDDLEEFLGWYFNTDIMHFCVKHLVIFDRIRRHDGKEGLLESFLKKISEEKDIPIHAYNTKTGKFDIL